MMAEGSSVLVTGAAGFLGLALVRALANAGLSVVATDRVEPASFILRSGTPVELVEYAPRDIALDRLDDLGARVSGIVHAAALTPKEESGNESLDDLLRVNLGGFMSVLETARASETCSRVIFVSSTAVYDQTVDAVVTERDADGGRSLYGAAKLAAEYVGRRYADLSGLEFCSVRPTSLFGTGETERPSRPRVTGFAQLVRAAMQSATVRLENPGSRADWLSVDDAANAVVLLWNAPDLRGRAFNVSSGSVRTFADVVEVVASLVPLRVTYEDADVVIDGGIDQPAVIVSDRIRDAVGWRPLLSLEDGVTELMSSRAFEEGWPS